MPRQRSFSSLVLSLALLASTAAVAAAPKMDVHTARMSASQRGSFAGGRFAPAAGRPGIDLRADLFIELDHAALPALRAMGVTVRTVLPSGLVTASAPVRALEQLAAHPGVRFIQAARQLHPTMDLAAGSTGVNALAAQSSALSGFGVIVGIIDSGIDIEHPDFQGRILKVWDHTIDPADVANAAPSPTPYGYGTVWSQAQVAGGYGSCAHRDENGHGTHVAGTAAGAGLAPISPVDGDPAVGFRGLAFESELLVVEYDFDNIKNRNSSAAMVDAVGWIFAEAAALGRPAVINMSLGSDYGPHDGSLAEERGIDQLSGSGKIVVVAAGNAAVSYTSPNRALWGPPLHGSGVISGTAEAVPDASVVIPAYTPTAGNGNDYVFHDLWYTGTCRVQITSPNGQKWPPSFSGAYKNTWKTGSPGYGFSTPQGYVYVANLPGSQNGWETNNTDNNLYVEISDGDGTNPAVGTWKIDLIPISIPAGATFHSWHGQSSNLNLTTYYYEGQLSDSVMTVGAPGSAKSVIGIAAYQTKNAWTARQYVDFTQPALGFSLITQAYNVAPLDYYDQFVMHGVANFSSRGPTRDGRQQPFIGAPGVGIVAALSQTVLNDPAESYHRRLNRINPTGWYTTLQGTSMATPCATGSVALLLEQALAVGGNMTPDGIKSALRLGARTDGLTGTVPNGDFGWGKIDVNLAMAFVQPPPPSDTVTITQATWKQSTKMLTVKATSTSAPSATLTATWNTGSGAMTYSAATATYTLSKKVTTKPPTVTVTSSAGGSANSAVVTQ